MKATAVLYKFTLNLLELFVCCNQMIILEIYLTNKTNRSDRLQFSGACGAIGAASADISADNGAHLASATSTMQSHSAMTKFNLANVSL